MTEEHTAWFTQHADELQAKFDALLKALDQRFQTGEIDAETFEKESLILMRQRNVGMVRLFAEDPTRSEQ